MCFAGLVFTSLNIRSIAAGAVTFPRGKVTKTRSRLSALRIPLYDLPHGRCALHLRAPKASSTIRSRKSEIFVIARRGKKE
jgi:hypothetical protein